jgi:hypothetical protein
VRVVATGCDATARGVASFSRESSVRSIRGRSWSTFHGSLPIDDREITLSFRLNRGGRLRCDRAVAIDAAHFTNRLDDSLTVSRADQSPDSFAQRRRPAISIEGSSINSSAVAEEAALLPVDPVVRPNWRYRQNVRGCAVRREVAVPRDDGFSAAPPTAKTRSRGRSSVVPDGGPGVQASQLLR